MSFFLSDALWLFLGCRFLFCASEVLSLGLVALSLLALSLLVLVGYFIPSHRRGAGTQDPSPHPSHLLPPMRKQVPPSPPQPTPSSGCMLFLYGRRSWICLCAC
jgi:hypothetical protein